MPIRPELRKYYLADWRAYRLMLIALARNLCVKCGAKLESSELTGAHMNHDPRDMALVAVLCFACHARHDAKHRLAMMRRTRGVRRLRCRHGSTATRRPWPRHEKAADR